LHGRTNFLEHRRNLKKRQNFSEQKKLHASPRNKKMDRQFQSTKDARDARDAKDSRDAKDPKDSRAASSSLINSIITFVLLFLAWLAWRDSKRLKKVFEKQGSCDPLAAGEIYKGLKMITLFTLLLWLVPIVMGLLTMIFVMSRFKKQRDARKADVATANASASVAACDVEDERNAARMRGPLSGPPPPPLHCFPMPPPVYRSYGNDGLYGRYN
jgi:uncharacterized membrane protein